MGVTTLEAHEPVFDPFQRELRAMTMPLMSAARVAAALGEPRALARAEVG